MKESVNKKTGVAITPVKSAASPGLEPGLF